MKNSIFLLLLFLNLTVSAKTYYVAVWGNDSHAGTIDAPWETWQKAFAVAEAGDTVYFRAGIYYQNSRVTVSVKNGTCNSGEPNKPISFMGYPPDIANGDSVIFDFINVVPREPDYAAVEAGGSGSWNHGLSMDWMDYFVMKDFTIRNVLQRYRYVQVRGMNFYGCTNFTLERVNVYNIGGQGIFSSNWTTGDSTYVINCDAHHAIDSFAINPYNYERGQAGSWGVGFFFVLSTPGDYVEFDGCRAWACADDGFNVTGAGTNRMKNCWSFINGIYLPYLDYTTPGNGYKMNSSSYLDRIINYPDLISHYATNSISAFNKGLGFTENVNGKASLNRKMYNNIAFHNEETGFAIQGNHPEDWEKRNNEYINNWSYLNKYDFGEYQGGYAYTNLTNSWNDIPGVSVTADDFITTLDSTTVVDQLKGARGSDGSLPSLTVFKLKSNSDLVDAGTNVGLPYYGSAPDIGCSEFIMGIPIINQPPEVMIISPAKESENKKTDNITFEITATDPDGTIIHVELRNGDITIAEFTEPPYIFVWHGVDTGTYYISALATDNMGATSVSPVIEVKVGYYNKAMSDMITLYPNPSDGRFTLKMDPLLTEQQVNRITIVNLSGKTIYKEIISGLESSKSYDLSGIDIGTYIILITNEKAIVATKKFIKL